MTQQSQPQSQIPMKSRPAATTTNNNKPIKLLILNPSPRNIKIFQVKLDKINKKYDVLRIKNDFDEKNAYNSGRKFFLEHTEYTHLAILPDDLLCEVEDVDKLISDLEEFNYPVISGICNFAMSTAKFFNNMSAIEYTKYDAVDEISRTGRFNYFQQIMSRKRYEEIKEEMKDKPNRIIRVALANFPLTIARRDVIEKFEFGANLMGVDTVFAQDCINNGIPQYMDLDVEMWHIKGIEQNHEMRGSIVMAFDRNVDTSVNTNAFYPPPREEIFLPAVQ